MRWIFYTLIAINMAVAGYFLTKPLSVEPVVRELPTNTSSLVLLSEFVSNQQSTDASGNESITASTATVKGTKDIGANPTEVASSKPVEKTMKPQPQTSAIEQDKRSSQKQLCYVLGPYKERLDARHAQARAEALGRNALIKVIDVPAESPSEHWVHVPPRRSRSDALSVLRALQKRSIDSYVITEGELENGISLGLFRNKDSANKLKRQVSAYGYPVDIQVRNKTKKEHWLELSEVGELTSRLRERIQSEDVGTNWELVACS